MIRQVNFFADRPLNGGVRMHALIIQLILAFRMPTLLDQFCLKKSNAERGK